MTAEVRELLPLYALGILDVDETQSVERAIASRPELAAELRSYQDGANQLITPIRPSPDVKARLMASVGIGPFERFAHRMGKLFDVGVERARELLGLMERPASWHVQIPGIDLVHFNGGPAYAAADCGFVRLTPGTIFPPHKHLGEEVCIVLTGQIRDASNNTLLGPGDDYRQEEGTSHHLICEGTEDCVFAVRAVNGIEVAGAPARPSVRSID
jgi:Cupin domain